MPTFTQDVQEIRRRAARKIEEGPVTQGYKGEVNRTIDILNQALATEIVCVLRYMHHYFMATGVHGTAVRDEFKEHADDEREHADSIAERIQQLGGKPDYNPRTLLERSASQYIEGETLADMIREDLIAERIVIEIYQDMIRHFANNDPTSRHMMEEILADEEQHASDLTDLLYIVEPSTGKTEGQDPGADPLKIGERSGKAESRPRSTRSEGANVQQQRTVQPDRAAAQQNPRTQEKTRPSSTRKQETLENRQEVGSGKRGNARANTRSTGDRQGRAAEPGNVMGERQRRERESSLPESAGHGKRKRGLAGLPDAEGGESHSGQQFGASRAVRQTQPNRKRRAA